MNSNYIKKKTSVFEHKWVFCSQSIIDFFDSNSENSILNIQHAKLKFIYIVRFLVICVKSFFRIFYYYISQFFSIRSLDLESSKCIVFESDIEYRHYNFFRIRKKFCKEYKIIQGFDFNKLKRFGRVSAFDMMMQFLISIRQFYLTIENTPAQTRNMLLANGAYNISVYVYLHCFMRCVNSNCNIFMGSGTSLLAFAFTSLNFNSIYISHGLIFKVNPLIFPDYKEIYVYSYDEKIYLQNIGLKSDISVYNFKKVNVKNKAVIIFLSNDDSDNLDQISQMIELFKFYNYKIYFKYHPLVSSADRVNLLYKDDVIDNKIFYDASSSILNVMPSFTVSVKSSTSSCESLNMGVIPIFFDVKKSSILYNEYKKNELNFVYPFELRSISWHNESNIVHDILANNINYTDAINMLKFRQLNELS